MYRETITQWKKKLPVMIPMSIIFAVVLATSQGIQITIIPLIIGVSIAVFIVLMIDILFVAIKHKFSKR